MLALRHVAAAAAALASAAAAGADADAEGADNDAEAGGELFFLSLPVFAAFFGAAALAAVGGRFAPTVPRAER